MNKEEIEAELRSLSKYSEEYKILAIVCIPDLQLSVDMVWTDDGKVLSHGIEYDTSCDKFERKGLVFTKKNGTAYKCLKSMKNMMNRVTMDLVGLYTSEIQRLFRTTREILQDEFVITNLDDIEQVDLSEILVDEEYMEILKDYTFYIKKPRNEKYFYPFILLKVGDEYMPYYMYKYVSGLSFSKKISESCYLPTVDHINRNTKDNRLSNLRYCSVTQNSWNSCRMGQNSIYHGVSENSSMNIICKSEKEERVRDIIRFWTRLIDEKYDSIEGYIVDYEKYYDKSYCGWQGLVNDIKDDQELVFLGEISQEILKLIPMLDDFKEDEDRMVNIEKLKEKVPFINCQKLLNKVDTLYFEVKRVLQRRHIAALGVDIYRIYCHGEFAHTNFLKVPNVKITCRENKDLVIKRPEEILKDSVIWQDGNGEKSLICEKKDDYINVELIDGKRSIFDGLKQVNLRDKMTSHLMYYEVKYNI